MGNSYNFFWEKSADLAINSELEGFENLEPLLFGKNLDRHTSGK